jgi:hypothetical protein
MPDDLLDQAFLFGANTAAFTGQTEIAVDAS